MVWGASTFLANVLFAQQASWVGDDAEPDEGLQNKSNPRQVHKLHFRRAKTAKRPCDGPLVEH